jgi:hypothetical protein
VAGRARRHKAAHLIGYVAVVDVRVDDVLARERARQREYCNGKNDIVGGYARRKNAS